MKHKKIIRLIGIGLLSVLLCGCTGKQIEGTADNKTASDVLYDNITISKEDGLILCSCDFNSDGKDEKLSVDYSDISDNPAGIGTIEVRNDSNQVIWSEIFALPYVGYKKYYITKIDEAPYLLEYFPPTERQGSWEGYFRVFGFDENDEIKVYEDIICDGTEALTEKCKKTAEEYIEPATLLVSTYGGHLMYYKYLE